MQDKDITQIAKRVTNYKIIIGAVILVLGTVGSLFFSALNFYITARTSPILTRVEAIESRDKSIEATLVDVKSDSKRIESKLDRVLLHLIPGTVISSGGNVGGK